MSQFNNQYRFNLESTHRITLKYDRNDNDCNIIFTDDTFNTSNQLNKLIGIGLNQNGSALSYGTGSKTAKIKFKIPCVGYFNSSSIVDNKILPEAFIKNFNNPNPSSEPFTNINDSYDMECNLLINGELEVENDITAFATYHSSDINLKENINTLTNCYDIVNDLNPVGFKWIKDNKDEIGFIAQEVEKVIPIIVNDEDEYKKLAETKIIAYLVGAIQELDKELKELEINNV
tara:strand:+ start:6134 stop:6829 length:696 start_codon:yes stop_codon:yes gene_type:complete